MTHRASIKWMTAVVVLSGFGLAGMADAASIGIQFVNANKNPTYNLEVQGLTAGVSEVAQSNWNSMVSGQSTATSITDLQDDSGTVIAGTSVSISGGTYYSAGGTFPVGSGDQALAISTYLSVFGGTPSATITGIPYAQYDVYVYGMNDNPPATNRHTSIYDGTTYSSFLATNDEDEWILATGTWDGTGSPPVEDVATYALFTGNTSSTLMLSWTSAGNSGVNGIQIVEVPEPASLGLLAAGGLTIFARRRKV